MPHFLTVSGVPHCLTISGGAPLPHCQRGCPTASLSAGVPHCLTVSGGAPLPHCQRVCPTVSLSERFGFKHTISTAHIWGIIWQRVLLYVCIIWIVSETRVKTHTSSLSSPVAVLSGSVCGSQCCCCVPRQNRVTCTLSNCRLVSCPSSPGHTTCTDSVKNSGTEPSSGSAVTLLTRGGGYGESGRVVEGRGGEGSHGESR